MQATRYCVSTIDLSSTLSYTRCVSTGVNEFLRRVDEYYEVYHVLSLLLPPRLPLFFLRLFIIIFILLYDSGDTVYSGNERVRGSNFRYNGCE